MISQKPLILITNDDGVNAPGLHYLTQTVLPYGDVIVVAPNGPRSGQSSAITVDAPLYINECEPIGNAKVYSTNGTPVDCVKLAMNAVVERKPALILSGINHGSNAGNSLIYSGTMGAVIEGCMIGIPSVGFSLLQYSWEADFTHCDKTIKTITEKVLNEGLPENICLNVNIPAKCTPKGLRTVRATRGRWTEEYQKYTSPHGRTFYWLTGTYELTESPEDTNNEEYWLSRQYSTIVPVRPDQSALDQLDTLQYSGEF